MDIYQLTQWNIPEDLNLHQHYCENLEPGGVVILR